MNDFTLQRLYFGTGFGAGDFSSATIKPNTVFLEPVRPPARAGSVIVGQETQEIPGQMCLVFRVLALGPQTEDTANVFLRVGDNVVVATRALDIMHPNTNLLYCDSKYILAVLEEK